MVCCLVGCVLEFAAAVSPAVVWRVPADAGAEAAAAAGARGYVKEVMEAG